MGVVFGRWARPGGSTDRFRWVNGLGPLVQRIAFRCDVSVNPNESPCRRTYLVTYWVVSSGAEGGGVGSPEGCDMCSHLGGLCQYQSSFFVIPRRLSKYQYQYQHSRDLSGCLVVRGEMGGHEGRELSEVDAARGRSSSLRSPK